MNFDSPTTTITAVSKGAAEAGNQAAAVVVIHGLELGRKYDLNTRKATIGRSSKSTIQIDQESVSRQHAVMRLDDGHVYIEDKDSTNGTYVNDEVIRGAYTLRNGDLIRIGRTILKFIASNNIEASYHDEVYRLTTIDGLTQVYNRRYFDDAIDREISRCRRHHRPLSLVMLDIDHFKQINDTFGHLAGDSVLKELASVVRTRIRREDIVSRYGGEEFALLLPEIEEQGAVVLAEKIRRLVEKHKFMFESQRVPVTISLGVSAIGKKAEDPQMLIRRADEKLYAAKTAGRNRVAP